ncbi:hypothetical protein SprV_0702350700 [Sparganum proliferum]
MLLGEEHRVSMVSAVQTTKACSFSAPAQNTAIFWRTPSSVCRGERRPAGGILGRVSGTCWTVSSPEGETRGRDGDKGDFGCRRMGRPSPRHLKVADLPVASSLATPKGRCRRHRRGRRCGEPLVPAAGHSPVGGAGPIGRERRQHHDKPDSHDAAISNLLAERKRLQKVYADRHTDDNAVITLNNSGCARCRMPGRLAKPRRSRGTRTATNGRTFSPRSKTSTVRRPKGRPQPAPHHSDAAIARLPQVETNADLDLSPSPHETVRAVQKFYSEKAPDRTRFLLKSTGTVATILRIIRPRSSWRCGVNGKSSRISRTPQQCITPNGKGLLPESQRGFRRHRGTTNMTFAARQLQEKCQEMPIHLDSNFVDLMKAFDPVNREGLWKIIQKFGCPERFTQMVRRLHDSMMALVTDNGALSEAFAVTNGVKQDCVLTPSLFSLMFAARMMDA